MRNNIKRELRDCKYPDNVTGNILDLIFGKQVGGTFYEGLVDAEDESAVYSQLEKFQMSVAAKEDENPNAHKCFFNGSVDTRLTAFCLEC